MRNTRVTEGAAAPSEALHNDPAASQNRDTIGHNLGYNAHFSVPKYGVKN